jgi:hypothetical protein
LAYFWASVNWAWWNTLDRSDTKKAIFIGFSAAGFSATGASVAGACAAGFSAGAWAGAGAEGAAELQAIKTRLVSTSTVNKANRFFFILFPLFSKCLSIFHLDKIEWIFEQLPH